MNFKFLLIIITFQATLNCSQTDELNELLRVNRRLRDELRQSQEYVGEKDGVCCLCVIAAAILSGCAVYAKDYFNRGELTIANHKLNTENCQLFSEKNKCLAHLNTCEESTIRQRQAYERILAEYRNCSKDSVLSYKSSKEKLD